MPKRHPDRGEERHPPKLGRRLLWTDAAAIGDAVQGPVKCHVRRLELETGTGCAGDANVTWPKQGVSQGPREGYVLTGFTPQDLHVYLFSLYVSLCVFKKHMFAFPGVMVLPSKLALLKALPIYLGQLNFHVREMWSRYHTQIQYRLGPVHSQRRGSISRQHLEDLTGGNQNTFYILRVTLVWGNSNKNCTTIQVVTESLKTFKSRTSRSCYSPDCRSPMEEILPTGAESCRSGSHLGEIRENDIERQAPAAKNNEVVTCTVWNDVMVAAEVKLREGSEWHVIYPGAQLKFTDSVNNLELVVRLRDNLKVWGMCTARQGSTLSLSNSFGVFGNQAAEHIHQEAVAAWKESRLCRQRQNQIAQFLNSEVTRAILWRQKWLVISISFGLLILLTAAVSCTVAFFSSELDLQGIALALALWSLCGCAGCGVAEAPLVCNAMAWWLLLLPLEKSTASWLLLCIFHGFCRLHGKNDFGQHGWWRSAFAYPFWPGGFAELLRLCIWLEGRESRRCDVFCPSVAL